MYFERTGNTWGLRGKRDGAISRTWSLLFWSRAASSIGKIEGWRYDDGFYFDACLWGWRVSVSWPAKHIPGPNEWNRYHKTLVNIRLRWCDYDRWRGGAFCHWRWAQRLARWREDRERERKLRKEQDRKDWFDRRSGNWWTFDRDEKRSYYKFCRAIYGLPATEAWKRACEKMDE